MSLKLKLRDVVYNEQRFTSSTMDLFIIDAVFRKEHIKYISTTVLHGAG